MKKIAVPNIRERLYDEILKDDSQEATDNSRDTSLFNMFKLSLVEQKKLLTYPKIRQASIVFDRKYATNRDDTNSYLWNVYEVASTNAVENVAWLSERARNIVSIKIHSFKFPAVTITPYYTKRMSILIDELQTQSTQAHENDRRYHWLLMTEIQPLVSTYYVQGTSPENHICVFRDPIRELKTVTLKFGDPFDLLSIGAYDAASTRFIIPMTIYYIADE